MNMNLKPPAWLVSTGILVLVLLSACAGTPNTASVTNTATPVVEVETAVPEPGAATSASEPEAALLPEVIVYASDLSSGALSELDFIDDSDSPGGKFIGLPNNGDELDPPPENDPHVTFDIQVQSGIPYRCWVHMKVGEPKGRSTANVVWVQFSNSVDQANQEVFRPRTRSYLTAQGPAQSGWSWVPCEADGDDSRVYFPSSGDATVRIQAGAEGVGFDQFILSPAKFLNEPPAEAIVVK